jgi:hypothetical protein
MGQQALHYRNIVQHRLQSFDRKAEIVGVGGSQAWVGIVRAGRPVATNPFDHRQSVQQFGAEGEGRSQQG